MRAIQANDAWMHSCRPYQLWHEVVMVSMDIQIYSEEWANEIADVFYLAVHAIDTSIYTQEQKEVWAPAPIDYEIWRARLDKKKPFVAIVRNRVAGFIELDADGHIDCTYTHPEFQRAGVASSLYEFLLKNAEESGIKRLYVEASLVAMPFFMNRGFTVIQKNNLERNGVSLVNFSMERYLSNNN
ncbi:GNAT family N-acetyltransferase [Nitrogeniibacter aestuarii]|uniref:GNAT family N-acetyltransferase n=1 Tax=Nitrogeniibacter aestuarii TaxID=2815343 RepID=UPI001D120C30|nr:GNAT family N-acetyltransferase [Nitrogeniibacter aestuarii]